MIPSSPSCTVASPRECNYATAGHGATSHATEAAPIRPKALSLQELRAQLRAQLTRNHGSSVPVVGADSTAAPFDLEWLEERAAIYEYDAGFTREEAERRAYLEVTKNE